MVQVRLQKILADAGIASRRHCEELILDGSVTVNRKLVNELPAFADPEKDVVAVNGKRIQSQSKVYFLLNKPKSVICTSSDPQGRTKAIDLINCKERIFCVGRLDTDTTGAIILTNDSELCNRLTHPKYDLPKTYIVHLAGRIEGETIEKVKKGIWLAEGKTGRAGIKVLKRNNTESLVEVTISEGRNRQVRRMFLKSGHKVKGLKRTHIGKMELKGLGVGKFRALTGKEIGYLKKVTEIAKAE
jgi:23S rRNA pseudouridine2605 synthase